MPHRYRRRTCLDWGSLPHARLPQVPRTCAGLALPTGELPSQHQPHRSWQQVRRSNDSIEQNPHDTLPCKSGNTAYLASRRLDFSTSSSQRSERNFLRQYIGLALCFCGETIAGGSFTLRGRRLSLLCTGQSRTSQLCVLFAYGLRLAFTGVLDTPGTKTMSKTPLPEIPVPISGGETYSGVAASCGWGYCV